MNFFMLLCITGHSAVVGKLVVSLNVLLQENLIEKRWIQGINPSAKIINMCDFNDYPTDKSVVEAIGDKDKITAQTSFYNPMSSFYNRGIGTSCYSDKRNVLDQVRVTPSLLGESDTSWYFWKAGIFN